MLKRTLVVLALGLMVSAFRLVGQTVTFHSPTAWKTQREREIVAKTLLDTAKIASKKITFSAIRVQDGKSKTVASRTCKVEGYSHEQSLVTLKEPVIGGRDFLRIEWRVPGSEDKGVLEPFGIVVLDEAAVEKVACRNLSKPLTTASGVELVADEPTALGDMQFCAAWTDKELSLVVRGGANGESITFCFDGKNGKNAFLSYADRFVTYAPAGDSLQALHYERSVSDTGIVYKKGTWIHEITRQKDGDVAVITVPWHDLGMQPFDGRRFGFCVFVQDTVGKEAAFPSGAQREIPGTWGDMLLTKG